MLGGLAVKDKSEDSDETKQATDERNNDETNIENDAFQIEQTQTHVKLTFSDSYIIQCLYDDPNTSIQLSKTNSLEYKNRIYNFLLKESGIDNGNLTLDSKNSIENCGKKMSCLVYPQFLFLIWYWKNIT